MKSVIEKIKSFFNYSKSTKNEDVLIGKGEKVEIKIPAQLLEGQSWYITQWHCEVGDNITPGDLICTVESKDISSDFEAYFHGKISYRNMSKGSLTKDTVMVEIVGD